MQYADVEIPEDAVSQFCRERHVRKLSLFGSILTAHFTPESDIDVLVEFEEGHVPGFFGLARLERELSALFGGRKVDVRTPADLGRHLREKVLTSACVQYEHETR